MLIRIPNGHVLFLGGWRKWVPMLVVWFTKEPGVEVRAGGKRLCIRYSRA
jgi:hypothetical protein